MDKEKFDVAETTLYDLLRSKATFEEVDIKNRDYYFIKCLDREIIKAARELIAAAGDDIAEKPTPAGQYVSDIIFGTDGTAIVHYNGGTACKRFDIFAKD